MREFINRKLIAMLNPVLKGKLLNTDGLKAIRSLSVELKALHKSASASALTSHDQLTLLTNLITVLDILIENNHALPLFEPTIDSEHPGLELIDEVQALSRYDGGLGALLLMPVDELGAQLAALFIKTLTNPTTPINDWSKQIQQWADAAIAAPKQPLSKPIEKQLLPVDPRAMLGSKLIRTFALLCIKISKFKSCKDGAAAYIILILSNLQHYQWMKQEHNTNIKMNAIAARIEALQVAMYTLLHCARTKDAQVFKQNHKMLTKAFPSISRLEHIDVDQCIQTYRSKLSDAIKSLIALNPSQLSIHKFTHMLTKKNVPFLQGGHDLYINKKTTPPIASSSRNANYLSNHFSTLNAYDVEIALSYKATRLSTKPICSAASLFAELRTAPNHSATAKQMRRDIAQARHILNDCYRAKSGIAKDKIAAIDAILHALDQLERSPLDISCLYTLVTTFYNQRHQMMQRIASNLWSPGNISTAFLLAQPAIYRLASALRLEHCFHALNSSSHDSKEESKYDDEATTTHSLTQARSMGAGIR